MEEQLSQEVLSGGEGNLSTGLRLSLPASPVSGIAFETLENGRGVGQGIGRSCSVSWCQESRHNSPLLLSSLETSSLSRSLTLMEAALGSSTAALPQGPIRTGCLQMPAQPEGRAPRQGQAEGSRLLRRSGTAELYFPTLLLAGESSAGAPHPVLPQHPAFLPSLSVSPERGMCSGHCGTCSQSPSSSFHPGFYKLASVPWLLSEFQF